MEEAERCDRLAFIHRGRLVAEDTPEGIKHSLADKDVFVLRCRYDPAVVARAERAAGVELVNQFGATLRLVTESGRYDERSIASALGLDTDVETKRDDATIEDVFVMLTHAREEAA
jgi:ABC-2 type transport system ATP-binding protein